MRWIDRLEPQISDGPLRKGRNYFRSGRVEIASGSDGHVEAAVQGSTLYQVHIDINGKEILASCTCPYFDDGDVCKHIWATFLAAESEGYLREIDSLRNPYIDVHFYDAPLEEPKAGPHVSLPKVSPFPKASAWKRDIETLRSMVHAGRPASPAPERRIVYLIESLGSNASRSLVVRAAAARRKKNGEWGNANFLDNSIRDVDQLDVTDQRILALMAGGRDYYAYLKDVPTRYKLSPASHEILMPMLCTTGRCYLKGPTSEALTELIWDDGPPWEFHIEVVRNLEQISYDVIASLKRENERKDLNDASLFVTGLVFIANRVARFDDRRAGPWLNTFRATPTIRVPFESRLEFLGEIAKFAELPPLDMPDELQIEQRSPDRTPLLRIRRPEKEWNRQPNLQCEVEFMYGSVAVAEIDPSITILDRSNDRLFMRDLEIEKAAIDKLKSLGMRRAADWQHHKWELTPSKLAGVTRVLLSEGWRVEAEGKLYRRSTGVQMQVSSGIDWFELEGQATFDDQVAKMPELLKAIARGENSVQLGDGSFGLLPEEWLERYRMVAGFGQTGGGQLRFARHQAGLLDALLASEPEVTFDSNFLRIREELQSFGGIQPGTAPETFKGQLRNYQRDGLGWLHFIRRFGFGGCLADDMGLGKTVQVLALLDSEARTGPALIVVPRSLVFNWTQEAARFAPRLRILDQTGLDRQDRWRQTGEYDIVLATYGTLRRDILVLKDIEFDTVILDEAQAIKNAVSESAKAVRLLKAKHRLVLTGTPIENRLNDLWSLFEFLNPGMLGTASVFRSHAIAKQNGSDAETSNEPLRIVSQALRPFILRRTKEQVARELPEKTEQTIYCELSAEQRRHYDELRDHYRESLLGRVEELGIQKTRMHILEALLRLRQVACHPGLVDKARVDESSAKLDTLLPQLIEVIEEGHKALVFSQFTSLLAILRKRLDSENVTYEYLDGKTRDREAHVRRFQEDPDCPLFLISLKAGGLGLNLTAAEYVFLLDPWWNPAVEAQAIDRSHRIGQTNHVFAYRLISRNTVEEKVLELQKTKRDLAEAIITADNSVIAGLTREHLELLLS